MQSIKITNLNKSFNKNKILRDININVDAPCFISIVGKSGSGKSTLVNILSGIQKPDSGKCLINGVDIYKLKEKELSSFRNEHIGFIYQHYNLKTEESILENIIEPLLINGYSRKFAIKEAIPLLTKIGLKEEDKDKKCALLSGGEKQRVAILRSIINSPEILIADEPTGALNDEIGLEIFKILKKISKNKIVIVISHNEKLVMPYSDRLIRLEDGKISEDIIYQVNPGSVVFNKRNIKKNSKQLFNDSFKLFSKHIKRNIFSFISLTFSLTSLFLIIGFSISNRYQIQVECLSSIDYGVSSVSKKVNYKIPNSNISLTNISRLENDELVKISRENYKIEYSFDYLLPIYETLYLDDKEIIQIEYRPIYSFKNVERLYGNIPNEKLDEVLINEECYNALINNGYDLNTYFNLNTKSTYKIQTEDNINPTIEDTFIFKKEFKITGVVKDFNFLATPKIYYFYPAFKEYVSSSLMVNYSTYLNKDITWFDYIASSKPNEKINSYSHKMFYVGNDKSSFFDHISNLKESDELEIKNDNLERSEAFISLLNATSVGFDLFVIISSIGTIFLLGLVAYSNYISDKKEIVISLALGQDRDSIISIYSLENIYVGLISLSISFIISFVIEKIINSLIFNSYQISSLVDIPFYKFMQIPLGFIVFALFLVIIITYFCSYIPIRLCGRIDLATELKDE